MRKTEKRLKKLLYIIVLCVVATSCSTFRYASLPAPLRSDSYKKPSTLDGKSDTPSKVKSPLDKQIRFVTPDEGEMVASANARDNAVAEQAEAQNHPAEVEPEVVPEVIPVKNDKPDEDSYKGAAAVVSSSRDNEHPSRTSHNPFDSRGVLVVDLDKQAKYFTYPIDGKYSSGYGARGRGWHSGVDLTAPSGTPIYAAFDGWVRMSKPYGGYGNMVVLQHENGLETLYGHCSQNLVREGEKVKAGQKIALCGRSGRASGTHLHFEIRVSGVTLNPNLLLNYSTKDIQNGKLTVKKIGSKITANRTSGSVTQDDAPKPDVPKKEEVLAQKPTEEAKTEPKTEPKSEAKPAPKTETKPTASSSSNYHTVVKGDTLYSIAKRNGTTVDKICALNNITKTIILKIGTKLRIK